MVPESLYIKKHNSKKLGKKKFKNRSKSVKKYVTLKKIYSYRVAEGVIRAFPTSQILVKSLLCFRSGPQLSGIQKKNLYEAWKLERDLPFIRRVSSSNIYNRMKKHFVS